MQVFGFQDEVLPHNRLLAVCSMEQQHWQTRGECCVVQSLSGAWLCDPMDCSLPGFPCPSLFPGIRSNSGSLKQRFYLMTSSSATLFSSHPQSSQHQGLFQWVSSLLQEAKVLALQLQHQSFQWAPRTDLLQDWWLALLAVQGALTILSGATVLWCSAFFWSNSHIHTWLLEKP